LEIGRFEEEGISKMALDPSGHHLGVTLKDGTVYLYKEQGYCKWEPIAITNSEGTFEQVNNEAENI
jgi:hypothetical protein